MRRTAVIAVIVVLVGQLLFVSGVHRSGSGTRKSTRTLSATRVNFPP